MVDLSTARRPPLLSTAAFLRQLPPASRIILRGSSHALAAGAKALGLPPSDAPCRAVRNATGAALWLGPDERLLIGPAEGAGEMRDRLQSALARMPHSLVETSHAQTALELGGDRAIPALNIGCPLDLDPDCFPVEMCTRTVFAKAQIVLWRTGPETFRVETGRSFAAYVTQILSLAEREL